MVQQSPYLALIQAAASISDAGCLSDVAAMDVAQRRAFLELNRNSLETAKRALGPNCSVPLRFEEAFFAEHADDLPHLRNLALAFDLGSRVAAARCDLVAAIAACIDTLELANAARRGGLVTDLLVGIVISRIAVESLREIRFHLDTQTRCRLIEDLIRLENEREPLDAIVKRDREWEAIVGYEESVDFVSEELEEPDECGLTHKEQLAMREVLQSMGDLPQSEHQQLQQDQDHYVISMMRLLAVDAAIRLSVETTGSVPVGLDTLSPDFLRSIPLDPFTGNSLIYRPVAGNEFVLYSTGPKKVDGGGKFTACHLNGEADLCLDGSGRRSDCWPELERQGMLSALGAKLRSHWRKWVS